MIIFTFKGDPNGNLTGTIGDQGFDIASGNPPALPNNYFICAGGSVWVPVLASGMPSGPWQGVVTTTVVTSGGTTATPQLSPYPFPKNKDFWSWKRFKDEVIKLTPADEPGTRVGVDDYYYRQIRLGVLELQRYIPQYRNRHESVYYPSDMTTDGAASVGTVPAGSKLRDIWFYDLECRRHYPVVPWAWNRRFELAYKRIEDVLGNPYVTLTAASFAAVELANVLLLQTGAVRHVGLIAIDPKGETFYLYPQLRDGFLLSINWDGTKLDFKDADLVPFGERTASCVANYVTAKIRLRIDRDIAQHDKFMADYILERRALYVDEKDKSVVDGTD